MKEQNINRAVELKELKINAVGILESDMLELRDEKNNNRIRLSKNNICKHKEKIYIVIKKLIAEIVDDINKEIEEL